MENDCESLRPGQACQYGNRFDAVERRLDDLEKGQDEEAAFRKLYQKDREERLVRDALLDEKIKRMDAKLDQILDWKDEQLNRPNRLLSGIADKLIGAVCAVIGAGLVTAVVYLIIKMNGI